MRHLAGTDFFNSEPETQKCFAFLNRSRVTCACLITQILCSNEVLSTLLFCNFKFSFHYILQSLTFSTLTLIFFSFTLLMFREKRLVVILKLFHVELCLYLFGKKKMP